MRKHLPLLAALAALALFVPGQATAQTYPWCSTSYDAVTCLYTSYDQCVGTVRGQGGLCTQNPLYPDREKRSVQAKGQRK